VSLTSSLVDRYEPFIAWRYLYRRRHDRRVRTLTFVLLALALVAHGVALFAHAPLQTVGTALAVPTLLAGLFLLLLNFFSGFTAVSIIGVTIGMQALMVVLGVTSGFQQAFKQKVLGVNAHVIVMRYGMDSAEYHEVMHKALRQPHVIAAAPFIYFDAMAATDKSFGVTVQGIDPALSLKVLDVQQSIVAGRAEELARRLPANDGGAPLPSMLMGKELAKKLHANLGDRVRLVSPKTDLDPAGGALASREFRLAGILYTGFQEYDSHLAYISVADAQEYSGSGDRVTGVELKLDDVDKAAPVAQTLSKELGGGLYHVLGWEELNHNLFAALRMQKVVISVILTLIVLVAAFNIVAAMTLLVIGKTKEIAILKSMGMRSAGVARLFQAAGLVMGGLGVVGGLGVGTATVWVLRRYHYPLDPHVYLIDQLPVKVNLDEVIFTVCVTLAICFAATLVPALRAARLEPVEGLRYE
jgi:lipoprotein-releasing system permease protein